MTLPEPSLAYDWNTDAEAAPAGGRPLVFDDESLRDGLQSPSVTNPPAARKILLLHAMAEIGIAAADVGLPGSGRRAAADAEALVREIERAKLPIAPNCAARTLAEDIIPILEIAQRAGRPVEVMLFVGSSPLRRKVEEWTLEELLRRSEECIELGVRHGAPVTFVTEDTTRSHPDDLRRLYQAAARAGAGRVCIADTAGFATPAGAARLVRFMREVLTEAGAAGAGIDWHGHNDRGLALANALAAAAAGADRLHATVLGVGERVGNPPMEQLLVNAAMLGWATPNLARVAAYAELASRILGATIPPNAPIVGRDAFRTSTGVHAAAIIKAAARGGDALADRVYSAVPAAWLGRRQEIDVGPMSGASNVRYWLERHGYRTDDAVVERIFAAAKLADRPLADAELHALASNEEPT